jgi:hypothetical protein
MSTRIGIVGHAQDKFVLETENAARDVIRGILTSRPDIVLVSGRCPLGGVDIFAEEIADVLGISKEIKVPKTHSWDGEYGYKARNLDIARCSDEVHVVLVKEYPPGYRGRHFAMCYHCARRPGADPRGHIKSGGCWTGMQALNLGKTVEWHIVG